MEQTITLEDVNENECQIIGVMVEGKTLIKLKVFNQFLQSQLDEGGEGLEISLAQTIMYIVENELNEVVSIPGED